ncbi:MAG TPA: hypothetical protein VGD90_13400 [Sphingobacteriaceae bacterium]
MDGQQFHATAQLLCPSALIFVVYYGETEPLHLEFNENGWEVIGDSANELIVSAIGQELRQVYGNLISRSVVDEEQYFILENGKEEIICFWEHDLRIRVTSSTENCVLGDSREQIYFGNFQNEFRAFQTIDYHGEDPGIIEDAIEWYTSREAEIAKDIQTSPLTAPSLN